MGWKGEFTATALAAVLLLSVGALPASAGHGNDGEVRIAVLDSGIRDSHETFQDGQVVAWMDFVNGLDTPYDDHGHGTAVASMAAGTNTGSQTDSHAPGQSLIVGKVLSANNGAAWSDVNDSIEWAVEQGADVITLSVYSYWPRPSIDILFGYSQWEQMLFNAIEGAAEHGVFVTILAGNGMFNSCLPTESWLHPPATSPSALIVGGAYADGTPVTPCSSLEPEVTAPYYVDVASDDCDTCYRDWQGTSFSTPLVAGIGANVIEAAQNQGLEPTPSLVEDAVKFAAEDTPAPPTLEGYGFLDSSADQRAVNELPDPGPDSAAERANQAYVESVQDPQRETWFSLNDR